MCVCLFSFPKARLWQCLKKLTMPKPNKIGQVFLFMGHQPFVMKSGSGTCLEFQTQPPTSSSPTLSDSGSGRAQSLQLATSDWNPGSQAAQKLGKWGRNLVCMCEVHHSPTPYEYCCIVTVLHIYISIHGLYSTCMYLWHVRMYIIISRWVVTYPVHGTSI